MLTRLLYNKYHKDAPTNAVNIMRGSPWGNQFVIGEHGDRDEVCDRFEDYATTNAEYMERVQRELYKQPLVCCCYPKRCHGNTLIWLANYCRVGTIILPSKY